MNNKNIKILIKSIINEMLDVVQEEHQTGEWWIDEDGSTTYADGDVGDRNHEGIVIETLVHEILYHFDIDVDEPGGLS